MRLDQSRQQHRMETIRHQRRRQRAAHRVLTHLLGSHSIHRRRKTSRGRRRRSHGRTPPRPHGHRTKNLPIRRAPAPRSRKTIETKIIHKIRKRRRNRNPRTHQKTDQRHRTKTIGHRIAKTKNRRTTRSKRRPARRIIGRRNQKIGSQRKKRKRQKKQKSNPKTRKRRRRTPKTNRQKRRPPNRTAGSKPQQHLFRQKIKNHQTRRQNLNAQLPQRRAH